MTQHGKFSFKTLDELKSKVDELHLDIPFSDDVSILAAPVSFGGLTVPNRLGCHPMEGCDGLANGAPSDLTFRRYERFGAGGAGLIWFEATAVIKEARANPRQIWLHDETLPDFKRMVERTREAAVASMGHNPVLVVQLTHSGRYSRPGKNPAPIIAHHSAVLDPKHHLPPDYPLITDAELDALQNDYVRAARLAKEAGFDAIDIKSCHRYLVSELLASHSRENSRYGGAFENRIRFLVETIKKIRQQVPGLEITSRLNVYDAISYPYGWGVDQEDYRKPDLTEPLQLIGILNELGYHGINVTIANPYFNPHYGRPYDRPVVGGSVPEEHPLIAVDRLLHLVKQVQNANQDMTIVGTGYSWLRQFVPYIAAGAVQNGWNKIAGLGRGAFAYPDFAKDILKNGRMEPRKSCVSCSCCTQIMRDKGRAGCVVRDAKIYSVIYREGRLNDIQSIRESASKCLSCIEPTCTAHCPAGIDIPAFLKEVADGNDRQAYTIIRRANIFPDICGYVCPVEVQCQGHCIKGYMDKDPLAIARIQRFVAEKAIDEGWTSVAIPAYSTGKRVAIIGAGPAGLSCAARLLEKGHFVVMMERGNHAGGKAIHVIPESRLPLEHSQAEIQSVFTSVNTGRLEWRWNTALGPDYTLDDILREDFDSVVLAFGLGTISSLITSGVKPEGVMDAISFLEHLAKNPDHQVPGKVAVIGGGNTAIDAAVTAKERGADDVYLIYRRSFDEMPAWPAERSNAINKGVHLLILTQPVSYKTDADGRLVAVDVLRTELGTPDESGRRKPVAIPGTGHLLPVTFVVEAIGEETPSAIEKILPSVALSKNRLVQIDPQTRMTTCRGVFAAGDLVNGGTTVVQAVAEGRYTAEAVDVYLQKFMPVESRISRNNLDDTDKGIE